MIRDLWLVGIGTGSPSHLTLEGVQALREAAVVLMPQKGDDKDKLVSLRRRILEASGSLARVVPFDYPERDPALPYAERVALWHDEIARRWKAAHDAVGVPGPVALMVWGDPSLYDSTLRIAARLPSKPRVRERSLTGTIGRNQNKNVRTGKHKTHTHTHLGGEAGSDLGLKRLKGARLVVQRRSELELAVLKQLCPLPLRSQLPCQRR